MGQIMSQGTLRELTKDIGVEISNFELKDHFSAALGAELRQLLAVRGVLVFKDQHMSPADQVAFTRMLGGPILDGGGEFELAGYPEINVLSNIDLDGKPIGAKNAGRNWHTDAAFATVPAGYTCLYGIETPERGGETAFGSLHRAYAQLSEEEKLRLRPLYATYSARKLFALIKSAPLTPEEEEKCPPEVSHPLMRVHPETGRECIYINDNDLVGIDGMAEDEWRALVTRVFAAATEEDAIYIHAWSPNDLVTWDNRIVVHTGLPYDMKSNRRLLHRCWTRSEVPIASVAA